MKNKIIIGVTGYLGSGKTTALKYFEEQGFDAIDADKVVHELYEAGEDGWRKVKDFFGEEYLIKGKGRVNRPKLRKVVFHNPAKLKILEKLIHPIVFNEIRKRIQKSKSNIIAIEAIIFDNKRLGTNVDYKIWIDAPHKIAHKRCNRNRKIKYDDYMKIVEAQKKPEKIDFVIKNNKTKKDLREKIIKVSKRIVSKINIV